MDIVICGSIVVDFTCFVDAFPQIGQTIIGRNFVQAFGGKGANQCVMSKLLGAKVLLIGQIGEDKLGDDYLENLNKLQINTSGIFRNENGVHTGVAQIVVTIESGENTIVVIPGSNLQLKKDNINKFRKEISTSKLILSQLEVNLDAIRHTISIANESSVPVLLNAAPIPTGLTLQDPLFLGVNILCVNENEAAELLNWKDGVPTKEKAVEAAAELTSTIKRNKATAMLEYVLITLGSQGAVVYKCSTRTHQHVTVERPVVCVDSTGAGDAFVGAVAYFYALHPDLCMEEICRRACQIAAESVTKPGTQISYSKKEHLDPDLFN